MTVFQDKTVLVTGGTGSMGKTFVQRLLTGSHGKPRKIIVFSRDEAKQHDMRMQYLHKTVATDEVIFRNFSDIVEFRIGDVRSFDDVCAAVRGSDIVVNAAALKQVPTCEYFPHQALFTNCVGAYNIVRAIQENGYPVQTVIGISTDKACKPVNVMGMTKAVQERIFVAANVTIPDTRFICVRYGNVLASRGSVVPLFLDQIRNGGPVTLTSPDMTRFLLSLGDAVETVIAAVGQAKRGETFIPNAPSATVLNIAKAMIGNRPIATRVIGVRPGEKMHEILVSEEEMHHCVRRGDYFAILPMLPELRDAARSEANAFNGEYSSADHVLDLAGTTALLKRHGLLDPQAASAVAAELLR